MRNSNQNEASFSPLISYILPVHNALPYLKYAVESVLEMSSTDFELIISDNHSSDASQDYLGALRDSRVRVISPPAKLKMNANFEFAISHARGEWIQLFGGDDAVLPWHYDSIRDISSNFPDIQIVNWNRAYYFWGEAQKNNDNLVASIELSSKIKILNSKSSLRKSLRGSLSIFDLPQLYTTSVIKRELVLKASRITQNTFFVGMIPDVFSSIQILLNEKKYLRIGCPLTLVGTSPKSTGASALSDFYERENEFVFQGVNCKSNANPKTSISLMSRKHSPYFLLDSLLDFFESSQTPIERSLVRMGLANFLSFSYLRLDRSLNNEIRLNLKNQFSKSIFDRIPVYALSFLYLCFIPQFKFITRVVSFISKRYIAPLDYKKTSYINTEFSSIKVFIDQIPKNKVKLYSRYYQAGVDEVQ